MIGMGTGSSSQIGDGENKYKSEIKRLNRAIDGISLHGNQNYINRLKTKRRNKIMELLKEELRKKELCKDPNYKSNYSENEIKTYKLYALTHNMQQSMKMIKTKLEEKKYNEAKKYMQIYSNAKREIEKIEGKNTPEYKEKSKKTKKKQIKKN